MISDLRFPAPAKSCIAAVVVLGTVFILGRPPFGDHRDGIADLVGEVLLSYGTFGVAVIALVTALSHIVRPSPAQAHADSWMALAVVVANATLGLIGYWSSASVSDGAPYDMAPLLLMASGVALVPALVAQIVYGFRPK